MTRIKLDYIHEFIDRHGKVRRYVRRPGRKRVPLPGLPGSEEFMAAYQLALDCDLPRAEIGAGLLSLTTTRLPGPTSSPKTLERRADASSNNSAPGMAISVPRFCSASTSRRCLPRSRSRPRSVIGLRLFAD
jgi:hypothetical protein